MYPSTLSANPAHNLTRSPYQVSNAQRNEAAKELRLKLVASMPHFVVKLRELAAQYARRGGADAERALRVCLRLPVVGQLTSLAEKHPLVVNHLLHTCVAATADPTRSIARDALRVIYNYVVEAAPTLWLVWQSSPSVLRAFMHNIAALIGVPETCEVASLILGLLGTRARKLLSSESFAPSPSAFGECIYLPRTFCANPAHNLTVCSPSYIIILKGCPCALYCTWGSR